MDTLSTIIETRKHPAHPREALVRKHPVMETETRKKPPLKLGEALRKHPVPKEAMLRKKPTPLAADESLRKRPVPTYEVARSHKKKDPQPASGASRISTAEQAALLPIMDPAVQLSLATGVMLAARAAFTNGEVPLVTVDVNEKAGDQAMNMSYQVDLENQEAPIAGTGTIASQPAQEKLTVGEVSHLAGTIGDTSSDLAMQMNENGNMEVDGQFGSVPAHLEFSSLPDPDSDGETGGFHIAGTLGGKPYVADATFDSGAVLLPDDDGDDDCAGTSGVMEFHGQLGDSPIDKTYQIASRNLPTGPQVEFKGSGTSAGTPQQVNVTMSLVA